MSDVASSLARSVLDHGSVRLTAITAGVDNTFDGKVWIEQSPAHLDLLVVRAARTSYAAAWRAGKDEESDDKLLNSLMRRGHTGPFEHMSVTFEVVAPIFVLRQWHRHRTQSYSEQSARYVEMEDMFYVPNPTLVGRQRTDDKQARDLAAEDEVLYQRQQDCALVKTHGDMCFVTYRHLINSGWPRELARTVLPVATYSKMFATANLLNWMRFLGLRCDEHAQYEIRVYADAIKDLLKLAAPVTMAAFDKYWPGNAAPYIEELELTNAEQSARIGALEMELANMQAGLLAVDQIKGDQHG